SCAVLGRADVAPRAGGDDAAPTRAQPGGSDDPGMPELRRSRPDRRARRRGRRAAMSEKIAPLRPRRGGGRKRRGCPICGAPAVAAFRPFCSPRCADIDLGRWLKEGYRVPTDEAPGEEEPGTRH